MQRITEPMIERLIDRLNKVTASPSEPWTKNANSCSSGITGRVGFHSNPGNYHLTSQLGGVAIERIVKGGGSTTIIERGTKREIFNQLHSLLNGISIGRQRG